jgi:uncharacterized protein YndB with AHSA1/START domain
MENMHDPIIVEQSYQATPQELWRALTQVDRMTEWFFSEIPNFRPEVG